jgi:hypothetical protein
MLLNFKLETYLDWGATDNKDLVCTVNLKYKAYALDEGTIPIKVVYRWRYFTAGTE